jgi:hypothetical protein
MLGSSTDNVVLQQMHHPRIIWGHKPEGPYVSLFLSESRTGGERIEVPLSPKLLVGLLRDASAGLAVLLAHR